MRRIQGTLLRYGAAVLAVALGLLLRWLLVRAADGELPTYVTFYPAVMLVALYGGLGPGLVATILAALVVDYWVITPGTLFRYTTVAEAVALGLFTCMGAFLSGVAELYRRARQRSADYEKELAVREELARAGQEWERTFQNVPDLIAILDPRHRIVRVNRAMAQRLGVSPEQCVGLACFRCVHGADAPVESCPHVKVLVDGREHAMEVHEDRLGGDFLVTCSPLLDERGAVTGTVHVARDITERKQAEQELMKWNETLEQRVAERTAEAEQRAAQLRALAVELAQAEQRERKRIAHILHDHFQQLLVGAKFDLSIVGSGLQDRQVLADLDRVSHILDEAIEASRSLAVELSPPVLHDAGLAGALVWLGRWVHERHHLPVHVKVDSFVEPQDENIRIVLFHAVQELLFNVVKHAKASCAAVTAVQTDDRLIRITIYDDGIGFDPQRLNQEKRDGSGFGLFSIQERLRVLGGDLEMYSEPDKGTRMVLRIPAGPEPADPPGGPASRVSQPSRPTDQSLQADAVAASAGAPTIRIVLADDHQVVRDGLGRLLQMQPDMEVVGQASDGREAVDLALRMRPDVMVMDISMPGLTGVEATRHILGQSPDVRVIGLSMHAEDGMARAMHDAGAVAYLAKTAGPEALIDAIRAAAGTSNGRTAPAVASSE